MTNFSYSIVRLFSYTWKWIGGGTGWYLVGPLGGVLGFIVGSVIDSLFLKKEEKIMMGAFSTNLLMLIASVMKVKMPVTEAKVTFVKKFLTINFGKKIADKAFKQLKEMLKQNIPLDDVCSKISESLDDSSQFQLMQFLYKLATIDGELTQAEQFILNIIIKRLSIKESVIPVVIHNDAILAAYQILGINRSTTVVDIKRAYRKLVIEYHPDKVAYLDEEQKKIKSDKFLQLTKAYDIIKKDKKFT